MASLEDRLHDKNNIYLTLGPGSLHPNKTNCPLVLVIRDASCYRAPTAGEHE